MPALLTRIETPPCSFAISSMSASIAAPSVTLSARPSPPCGARRSPIARAPDSVVAVPMTFAPSAASSSAIAAPMPRLAPVTSAVSPVRGLSIGVASRRVRGRARYTRARRASMRRLRAKILQRGFELRGRAERARVDRLVDAFDETREHFAGTAFDDLRRAGLREHTDALRPAHRKIELPRERIADRRNAGVHGRIDVLHDRN